MEIPIDDYFKLKPTALYILYELNNKRLNFVDETNQCGKIIRMLYLHKEFIK